MRLYRWPGLAMVVLVLAACASDPVVRGMGQEEAQAFILGKVGTQVPANVQLAQHYRERYTKTTDTEFTCNHSDRLERVTNYTVTRVEGNYVEIDASHYEDCDAGVSRYKLNGWFNERYLYLRTGGSALTRVYVMDIEANGRKLTDRGNYRYEDGVLSWQAHVRNGQKRPSGGYHFSTGYVAQTDAAAASGEYSSMLERSQQARRAEPSTASQIAQFSGLLADQLNQQSAARARDRAAALERQNQLQAAAAASRLVAASSAPSSRNTPQPSTTLSPVSGASAPARTQAPSSSTRSEPQATQLAQQRQQEERQRSEKAAAERKAAEERLAADRAAAEQAAAQKAVAAKAAAEERKARREAEQKASAEAKAKAQNDYLRQLAAGTRLGAKNCYGEQHVMGALPNIKPKPVSCIDMHFRAYCRGSHPGAAYQGVLKNMVSMGTGCFGDTVQIKPKLACKAEDIVVEATQARPCS